MAQRREKRAEEVPAGPGEWIVTFSDCMTLLLCFFVLLLTFSSFDEVEMQKLAGVFKCETRDSIFPNPREIKDSMVQPIERVVHMTEEGSEVPAATENRTTESAKQPPVVADDDAYKDRKTFYIPSSWLFWGDGTELRPDGRESLMRIATFMAEVPSRVIIAENVPPEAREGSGALRLDRALTVMRLFTGQGRLPAERFNISAGSATVPARLRGQRVVAITLISREVY